MKATTLNVEKIMRTGISDFKIERCLRNHKYISEILCAFKINKIFNFIRSKCTKIQDGMIRYCQDFCYEYELEIFNITKNILNHCVTFPIIS